MTDLPSYDQLPVTDGAPAGSSWGVWGDDDVFGCLNLLTPQRAVAGAACVRRGAAFALNWQMELPDPPLFGRAPFAHEVSWLQGEVGHDDHLSGWNTQSSSQWDGFRHIRHATHGFYGGVDDEAHGIHHWARRGLVGRGVLCDVGRWRESDGRALQYDQPDGITASDIESTLAAQGVVVEPGDVLLLRTGWTGWYRGLDGAGRSALAGDLKAPGLQPSREMLALLWDLHVAAVAGDNPALEAWPPGSHVDRSQLGEIMGDPERRWEVFMHFAILPLLGLPIGEMWDLEALAADCASDGVYECLFTSAPLNLASGVASPPNALAVK
ncbi:MAG TPA: cyclase family protein [Acidimicrobiales bacterium]|nr:cyclase family protein [Acidimicrobiales bacterium]